jgi:hypothetical protein
MSTIQKPKTDLYYGKEGYGMFSNKKLEVLTLFAVACIGVMIKLGFNSKVDNTGYQGAASGTLWGYGISIIAIACILFINIGLVDKKIDNKDLNIFLILISLKEQMVFILLLALFVLVIVLNYSFYNKINRGIIPLEFTNYNLVSGLLIIVQLGVLFQYLNIDILKFNSPNKGDKGMLKTLMYLLSTVNFIFIIIMYILLNYYSTDG